MAPEPVALPPLYRPELERDACGVALAADVAGRPSRDLVERALVALERLTHRGATGGGRHAVDGAGLLLQIPWSLVHPSPRRTPLAPVRALGMFFLPAEREADARAVVARALAASGWRLVAWREVPVDPGAIRHNPDPRCPAVRQAILEADGVTVRGAARALLDARRRIEHAAGRAALDDLDVVSLSTRTVVYKGLVTPEQLPRFFPDLADARCTSAVAIAHQRFSTNTFPRWGLAQPFRLVAHNGEINTIAGNRAWMRAAERDAAALPGWRASDLGPIVTGRGSDSQSLDEAVGLLHAAGFSLPHALSRLMPPAWESDRTLSVDERAFLAYQASASEPWDGPAALAFSDGVISGMALDRNGLRPARYVRTADGRLYAGSEAGAFDVEQDRVLERGRLGPGEMIVVDAMKGLVRRGGDVRRALAISRPYRRWLDRGVTPLGAVGPRLRLDGERAPLDDGEWRGLLRRFGCDREELEVILRPLAGEGKEAVGSMGDDTPPAALSSRPRLLSDFFRQRFAQVTNPPMDPLRERTVMSLTVLAGRRTRILEETGGAVRLVALESPVLTPADLDALSRVPHLGAATVILGFDSAGGPGALAEAIERIEAQAADAVRAGAGIVVLSDRRADRDRALVPALLATAAVHRRLGDEGLRMQASLVGETGEARDAHQCATLLAFGASAVCPWLGLLAAERFASPGEGSSAAHARYRRGLEDGLLKIFSKMGVSTAGGYTGAALFETIGLAPDVRNRFFAEAPGIAGTHSLEAIAQAACERQRLSREETAATLHHHGFHGYRRDGDHHAFNPEVVRRLHRVARDRSADAYRDFVEAVQARPATAVRDLLDFRAEVTPCPIDDVEPAGAICRRFFASAMSVGALSPEAHRVVAIAVNRLGARSNSGEGGEEPERCSLPGGREANSATKQFASGRFGVTPAYLVSASELQIKMAQGSKPGEGGQLPASKVVDHIARLRFAQPGTSLISPPPHHDIYSIEDLAQLVFDLRAFQPAARINVKLVSQLGVGIVAAGVVKAGADAIQISGHAGGTGASPRSSIKHAGMPWEIGLAEAHQVLGLNGLRHRVVLQVDGGLATGRDVVLAAALGADEFGFGTAALVAVGCVMARQCHLNTCPVGVATQRDDLRAKFVGTPDEVTGYLALLAEDVRRLLASLGVRSLAEMVGRTDLLRTRDGVPTGLIDVGPLLHRMGARRVPAGTEGSEEPPQHDPSPAGRREATASTHSGARASGVPREQRDLNDAIADALGPRLGLEPLAWRSSIRNTDRTVGARLAGLAAARFGDAGPALPVTLWFEGAAGQSFGAWSVPGLRFMLTGEANDYVGKGMHGGEIVVAPPTPIAMAAAAAGAVAPQPDLPAPGGVGRPQSARMVLAGNAALYGATGGRLFIAGAAGERFAVRNSGATAVVEGVGDHGCEYMTAGLVVVLGPVGRNFAAGMTGGVALVLDDEADVEERCNAETVGIASIDDVDLTRLRALLEDHASLTGSACAARLVLDTDERLAARFRKVAPLGRLGLEASARAHGRRRVDG
jgi:glutamate synthase domain-containing protein 2/glutamate synthase domain-containing protein 1/glutamate synthase domain-containing protein 3